MASPDKFVWLLNYFRYKREKFRRSRVKNSQRHSNQVVERYCLVSVDGLTLLLDRRAFVDLSIIDTSEWERPQIALLKAAAKHFVGSSRVFFLDVGAYWGLYSLHMLGAGVEKIFAFEPDPENHAQLLSQLLLNGALSKVVVCNFAISSVEQVVAFKSDFYEDGNRGTSRIVPGGDGDRTVRTSSLDNLFDEVDIVLIAKIDVEGHQDAVLAGMCGIISRNKVFLQVEIDDRGLNSFDSLASSLGLRRCGVIDVDHYYTNLEEDAVWKILDCSVRIVRV